MTKSNNRMSRGAAGFTLLEVLVAVVVLSVGLLGLASLQVNGLRFNHSAYMRTQATLLAEEIADRMRANRPGFLARDTNNYILTSTALVNPVAACETATGCPVSSDMARNDLAQWQRSLAALLPNGQGVVCLDTPTATNTANDGAVDDIQCTDAGTTYAIKIWWDDNRDGVADQRFVVTLN